MEPIPEWIVAALGLPGQCVDFYEALLRLIRNAFTFSTEGPITIVNNNGELSIVVDPDFIQAGPGISVVQNPDQSFTISALGGPGGTFVGSTTTITVTGTGTALDPYLPAIAPGALIGTGSTTVTQNPDGTFTIDSSPTPTSVDDSATITHTGTGTGVDPYIFNLAAGALVAGPGIGVAQAPNGVVTISNTGANPVLDDSDTIDVDGTGTLIDPYTFSLGALALLAGTGITVTQDPVTKRFTITSTVTAPFFNSSATNVLGGTGTVVDPYTFTFAPNSILAGAGISIAQAPSGVFTITATGVAPILQDTPTIDVSGDGSLLTPYEFAFAANSILAGVGIAVVQNPNGTFTISNTGTDPVLDDTATILVSGTGTLVDPYLFSFAPNSVVAGAGITVTQALDGTFTITATGTQPVLGDTPTIDVTGTGTLVDPYLFNFAPGSITGAGGTVVVQNPDGTFTISSGVIAPTSIISSPTIDVSGTGTLVDPYIPSLSATAIAAGAGISVVQNPDDSFTITNTGTQPILQDTATIDVSGDGSVLTPYEFAFALNSILAGAGISVVQNPNGTFTISNTGTQPILQDTPTIDVSGDGSVLTPYEFAFAANSILAGTGIGVVQNPNGTFTITNTSPASGLVFGNSATNVVSGNGTIGTPYIFTFAANSIVAGAGGITVSQAGNGVFTIGTTATTLLFWTEAYNATQDITRWNAVNNSIVAFTNARGFTLNRILTNTIAASALGADAVDLHQSTALANTARGANSAIIAGTNNTIDPVGARSAVLTGDLNSITGAGCVVLCGNSHALAGALSAILCGSLNRVPTGSSNSAILCGTQNAYAALNDSWGSCLIGGEANTLGTTNITSSILAGSQNNISVSTASSILGGTSGGVGNSTASAIVTSTGGVVSLSTGSAILSGNSGFVNQGTNSAIVAGNDGQVSGANSVILGGTVNNFLTTTSARSLIGVGSNNTFSVQTTDSAIIAGMNANTTAANIGRIAIVTGNGNTMNGAGTIGDCAILAGTTNQVLAALVADNVFSSSILSGVNVNMTLSNTHNLALARLDPSMNKKMALRKMEAKTSLVGSCAGGSHVTMGASHAFAMGNEVHVTADGQGSLTSGSYLTNTKKHSTLIGCHGVSSQGDSEILGVCNGTYNDPKTLASIGRDNRGVGVVSTDSVRTSGGTTSYLFPKSETFASSSDVGYFVSLDREGRVIPCDDPTRAIGVTVPRTGIILNSHDQHWHKKYLVDDFDQPITHTSYVDSLLDEIALLLPEEIPELEGPTLPSFSCSTALVPRDTYLKQESEHRELVRSIKTAHREKRDAHRAAVLQRKQGARDQLHTALRGTIQHMNGEELLEWAISTFSEAWPELQQLKGISLSPRQVPTINPDYDNSLSYKPRIERTDEWVPVAQRGVVRVRCDSSCLVGDLCHVSEGRATLSTNGEGWRVLNRVSSSVVTVML